MTNIWSATAKHLVNAFAENRANDLIRALGAPNPPSA